MEQMTQDAMSVLAATGNACAHVIGHSAGAGVGMMLAARQPNQVASLTLIGGWTKADLWMRRAFQTRLDSLESKGALAYLEATTLFMRPPEDLRERGASLLDEEQRALLSFPGPTSIRARVEAVLAWDSAAFSTKLTCPTLVVGSADDQMTPFYFSQDLARDIPGASLHQLDKGGHYCVRSQPKETLEPILAFLASTEEPRAS
jgi:aminoacrylate hydrolase